MTKPLSILCVHGVGHGDNDGNLVPSWTDAIIQSLQRWDADIPVTNVEGVSITMFLCQQSKVMRLTCFLVKEIINKVASFVFP